MLKLAKSESVRRKQIRHANRQGTKLVRLTELSTASLAKIDNRFCISARMLCCIGLRPSPIHGRVTEKAHSLVQRCTGFLWGVIIEISRQ
jgi:hypothetical protein